MTEAREPLELRIRHSTEIRYESGAAGSFNEARMTPLTTSEQLVLRSRLDIKPSPWMFEYTDYWGTTVTAFQVQEPHDELVVVATSTVQTRGAGATGHGIAWDGLAAVSDEFCEFLSTTELVEPSAELLAALDAVRTDAETPAEFARGVVALVDELASGEVSPTELAHRTIGALRTAGVPARYVSGYLHSSADPQVGESVDANAHAWVEFWDGEWVGVDPTTGERPGSRHIAVARGRDHGDNPPLRGIYSTDGDVTTSVTVEITRIA